MIKSNINDLIKHLKDFGKEIEKIDGKQISLKCDKNNMIERQCPNPECDSIFKVNSNSLENNVDDIYYCPYCKQDKGNQSFFTDEQNNSIKQQIIGSISDVWYAKKNIPQILATIPSSEDLELSYNCEQCFCEFSTWGTAYFCPSCGSSVVESYSDLILDKIKSKLENIDTIYSELIEKLGTEDSVFIKKSIVEKSLSECITVLQSTSEIIFKRITQKEPEFNAFQNIEKSNKHWQTALSKTINDWLSETEIKKLNIAIQRRHILEHKNGILDELYFRKTNDKKYKIGQRLVIKTIDVIEISTIISKLLKQIKSENKKDCP